MTFRVWQWAHDIHVDVPEPGIWTSESPQWSLCISCYFRSLAAHTGFGPVAAIYVHFRPHETGADELQMASKTCRRMLLETRGLGFPEDTLQSIVPSLVSRGKRSILRLLDHDS